MGSSPQGTAGIFSVNPGSSVVKNSRLFLRRSLAGERTEGYGQLGHELLREGTRALGLKGTARTLSRFWYFSPVMELWEGFLNLDVDIHTYAATEGNKRLVLHLQRERNPAVVRKKKKQASSLDCEVCGFSFGQAYGSAASDYCEVHHLLPLSEVEHTTQTRLEDLAILCANCHRVTHPCLRPQATHCSILFWEVDWVGRFLFSLWQKCSANNSQKPLDLRVGLALLDAKHSESCPHQ